MRNSGEAFCLIPRSYLIPAWVFYFFLLCSGNSYTQNLIPDSSFENNAFIPLEFSAIGASRTWRAPSLGTSDLFCKCSKKQRKVSLVNVPKNCMGNQTARSGSCYAGFFAHSHGTYREYIQSPLKQELEKNRRYRFKMYISLADYSRVAPDQLAVCFLKQEAHFKTTGVLNKLHPQYLKIEKEIRKDTAHWHCLTLEYKASGGEAYILIGSFEINELEKTQVIAPKEVHTRINQSSERDAYYYVDDVSLMELPYDANEDSILITDLDVQEFEEQIVKTDSFSRLIFFNTNEFVLTTSALSQLNDVPTLLRSDPSLRVEISGYTDNTGTVLANQTLSEQRAQAVKDFLISHQVEEERITSKAYGILFPLSDNLSSEGKQQNRRVALRLIRN